MAHLKIAINNLHIFSRGKPFLGALFLACALTSSVVAAPLQEIPPAPSPKPVPHFDNSTKLLQGLMNAETICTNQLNAISKQSYLWDWTCPWPWYRVIKKLACRKLTSAEEKFTQTEYSQIIEQFQQFIKNTSSKIKGDINNTPDINNVPFSNSAIQKLQSEINAFGTGCKNMGEQVQRQLDPIKAAHENVFGK